MSLRTNPFPLTPLFSRRLVTTWQQNEDKFSACCTTARALCLVRRLETSSQRSPTDGISPDRAQGAQHPPSRSTGTRHSTGLVPRPPPAPGTLTYPRTTQSVLVCSLLPGFTFFSRLQPLCYFSAPLPALCTPAELSRRAAVSQTAPPAPGASPCPALYVQFLLNLNRVQDLGPDPKHSMV